MVSAFTIADYDDALALRKRCESIGLSAADERESIRAYLERNPGSSFEARSEDVFVGVALCGHDGRRGYLHHLAVDPAFCGRGIGTALVEECLTALRAQGIQKCHVFVYGENESAIAWWRRRAWTFRTDIAVMSVDVVPPA